MFYSYYNEMIQKLYKHSYDIRICVSNGLL